MRIEEDAGSCHKASSTKALRGGTTTIFAVELEVLSLAGPTSIGNRPIGGSEKSGNSKAKVSSQRVRACPRSIALCPSDQLIWHISNRDVCIVSRHGCCPAVKSAQALVDTHRVLGPAVAQHERSQTVRAVRDEVR